MLNIPGGGGVSILVWWLYCLFASVCENPTFKITVISPLQCYDGQEDEAGTAAKCQPAFAAATTHRDPRTDLFPESTNVTFCLHTHTMCGRGDRDVLIRDSIDSFLSARGGGDEENSQL